jgi:hypothetical protein
VPDITRWLADHGVTGTVLGEACFEVESGVPPAPGFLCRESPGPKRRTTVERLYRVDGGRIVRVWSGTVAVYSNWVDLVAEIDADGRRLVLRDRSACACESAYEQDREKQMASVQPYWLSEDLHAACSARGAYIWSGQRYVRDLAAAITPECTVEPYRVHYRSSDAATQSE